MIRNSIFALVLMLTALSGKARAQQTEAPDLEADTETSVRTVSEQDPAQQTETGRDKDPNSQVEWLSKELEREKELRREQQKELDKVTERLDEMELENMTEASSIDTGMDVFGFMDTSFHKAFIHKDDVLHGVINDYTSFLIPHINLYFSSTVNRTTSALVELRFGFFPQGQEDYLPSYHRVDTRVVDPHTAEELSYGGVSIERAKITWQPTDAIGITVGRYFTPFGIWNIDHSPTILISILMPWVMVRQTVPLAQTGAMLHGRFFPGSGLRLDYALTVSNGRGPAESFYDVDDNKALGLRLRGTYENREIRLAVGAYGYYGDTTDITKNIDSVFPFRVGIKTTERFSEMVGSADVLFEIAGLRFQFEGALAKREYSKRPFKKFPIVNEEIPGRIQPDHIRYDLYGLIAYRFHFESLGGFDIVPWVMLERSVLDDSSPVFTSELGRVGINFSPDPQFVVKLSVLYMNFPDDDVIEHDPKYISAQVALSF